MPPPPALTAPALPPRRDAAALALVLASVLVMLLLGGVAAARLAPASVRPAPPPPPPLPTLARVQQVVDAQGLKGRVQVVMGPAGLPRVEGLLDDEALIESLGSALARLQPRPAMRVWSPATLRSALPRPGITLPPGLSLRFSPQGAAVLSGPVAGPEAVQALAKLQLRALLPALVPWVDELLQPPQLAERFIADARAQLRARRPAAGRLAATVRAHPRHLPAALGALAAHGQPSPCRALRLAVTLERAGRRRRPRGGRAATRYRSAVVRPCRAAAGAGSTARRPPSVAATTDGGCWPSMTARSFSKFAGRTLTVPR